MNCQICKGACCEEFTLEPSQIRMPSRDIRRWLELHANPEDYSELTFECRCNALTDLGNCGIYGDRPEICKEYTAGGQNCLETVKKRRSIEEYLKIRDLNDPLDLEGI